MASKKKERKKTAKSAQNCIEPRKRKIFASDIQLPSETEAFIQKLGDQKGIIREIFLYFFTQEVLKERQEEYQALKKKNLDENEIKEAFYICEDLDMIVREKQWCRKAASDIDIKLWRSSCVLFMYHYKKKIPFETGEVRGDIRNAHEIIVSIAQRQSEQFFDGADTDLITKEEYRSLKSCLENIFQFINYRLYINQEELYDILSQCISYKTIIVDVERDGFRDEEVRIEAKAVTEATFLKKIIDFAGHKMATSEKFNELTHRVKSKTTTTPKGVIPLSYDIMKRPYAHLGVEIEAHGIVLGNKRDSIEIEVEIDGKRAGKIRASGVKETVRYKKEMPVVVRGVVCGDISSGKKIKAVRIALKKIRQIKDSETQRQDI